MRGAGETDATELGAPADGNDYNDGLGGQRQGTGGIQMQGVFLKLGKNKILTGIDMNIRQGEIYTLLGPSGCGKTTLMKTMLGLFIPDDGHVSLFGHEPRAQALRGKISYVPQSQGLHKSLKVSEHLEMYARVAGLTEEEIEDKLAEFDRMLELPKRSELISSLSFGEQKLVSLCAALVGSPSIAILDEPTVGLDPTRRRKIWDYFEQMVSRGHIVVVTTHHVNEAYRANTVAVMYGGKIVVEDSPDMVCKALGVESMEEAYLKAYSGAKVDPTYAATKDASSRVRQPPDHLEWAESANNRTPHWWSMLKVVASIFAKTLSRNIVRDLCSFGIMLMFFLTVRYCIGPDPFDLPVAVINDDQGHLLADGTGTGSTAWGNLMVDIMTKDEESQVKWFVEDDLENAIEMTKRNERFGVLHIYPNFTKSANLTGGSRTAPMPYKLHLDATDCTIKMHVVKEIYQAWLETMYDKGFSSDNQNPQRNVELVHGKVMVMTNFYITATYISTTVLVGMISAGMGFMSEKKEEALDRLNAVGVPSWMIFAGDILAWVPWIIIDFPVRFGTLYYVMDGPFQGRIPPLFVFNVLAFIMGHSLGILISVSCESARVMMQSIYMSFSILYLGAGCIWPVESQPWILYKIAMINPLTWLNVAFRAVFMRNAPITDTAILVTLFVAPVISITLLTWAGMKLSCQSPLSKQLFPGKRKYPRRDSYSNTNHIARLVHRPELQK